MNVVARPWHYASMCSGAGGLDLGIKLAVPDARCVLYAEREVSAAAELVARMQDGCLDDAPLWDDLRTLDGKPWRGRVDCLAGGIPCQGYSLAGKRLLHDDERSLWPEFRRLLREAEPSYCFLENVPGLLVPDRGRKLTAPIVRVCGELAEDGWDAEWLSLSCADLGDSQKRERVFVLARRRMDKSASVNGGQRKRQRVSAKAGARPQSRIEDAGRTVANARRQRLSGGAGLHPAGVAGASGSAEADGGERQRLRDSAGDGSAVVANADREHWICFRCHRRYPKPTHAEGWHSDGSPAGVYYCRACRDIVGDTDSARRQAAGAGCPLDGGNEPEPGCGTVDDAARDGGDRPHGQTGSGRGVCSAGNVVVHATSERRGEGRTEHELDGGRGAAADASLPLFPPGPGLGGFGVLDDLRKLLRRNPDAAWRRYQAELANTIAWCRVLALRPDLAPAIESEVRGVAVRAAGGDDLSRTDQLRMLGNLAVPVQVAIAFRVLWHRLHGG